MRCITTGTNEDGRSCVVKERELVGRGAPIDPKSLFRTHSYPPPSHHAGRGELRDLMVQPGQIHWLVTHYQPHAEVPMHYTNTLDCDLVVEGSMELILDDGAHHLEPGDAAVITGVDHAWRAGPNGCTLSIVLVGTPPPD
jgi:quercetin dioxygenase-like cupin family protein